MKKRIPFRTAAQASLALFALIMLFHLAIIVGITAFDYAPIQFLWGGRMQSAAELLQFEIISLVVMAICTAVVAIRAQWIKLPKLLKTTRLLLYVLTALFLLNTLGNALATTTFEKCFAIITALLAILSLRMALQPINNTNP